MNSHDVLLGGLLAGVWGVVSQCNDVMFLVTPICYALRQ